MHWKDSVKSILMMPTIYMVPLAFALKALPFRLETMPLWPGLVYIKDGLISFALLTLGVQLSKTKFSFKNSDVYLSSGIRLIGGPLLAFAILKVIGINGIAAQTLMISSAIPTAVNTALIASQFGFSNFVQYFYPIMGYGGILLLVCLTYKGLKRI